MASRFVLADDGTSLHVPVDGPEDGEPVMLVHGWPIGSTNSCWSGSVPTECY